ncbi:MAG: TolC family protein, partial [Flavobacteriaceae bacterium]|nr:TolC family protein [Flavobacteriaceae bacterium]
ERTARTQRAQINYEKAKIELTEAEQQLALKTATAKNEYQYAIQQYQTAKMNLALAERIEKKNEIKFFEGVGSSFDLHQAQIQLYTAQNEYLQSMLDVLTKKADLETILTPVNNN